MRLSKIFNLNKTQHELDFVDLDINRDTPLFLDPYFLSLRTDAWSITASLTIKSYFQNVIDLIKEEKDNKAIQLLSYLGEPNETCLGLSRGRPSGRGIGQLQAEDIFNSLSKSKAVKTGLVEDLEDCQIFIDNIGKDKVSDMTTNIIKVHLIKYTQQQCNLWGISLTHGVPTGYYWNREKSAWESTYTNYLIVKNHKILLIPKAVVSYCDSYTPQQYYQHFVLNFLKSEHLRLGSHLVRTRQKRNGEIISRVYKTDVQKESPLSKDFLIQFTEKHPKVFSDFKERKAPDQRSLDNDEISGVEYDVESLCEHLVSELKKTPAGNNSATQYHKLIFGVFELLFYPHLMYPQIEKEIHEGRKRIDILVDNAAKEGFFYQLHTIHKIPCQYIAVECKNYNSDPANPELDQICGRFSPNRGKFGIVCCRKISDQKLFIKRCIDTFKEDRGLVIPLTDIDLIESLDELGSGNYSRIFDILNNKKRDITVA